MAIIYFFKKGVTVVFFLPNKNKKRKDMQTKPNQIKFRSDLNKTRIDFLQDAKGHR